MSAMEEAKRDALERAFVLRASETPSLLRSLAEALERVPGSHLERQGLKATASMMEGAVKRALFLLHEGEGVER